ncbi:DNA/pantothenate metabolism flavoprotein dfp [Mycobacterium tuberculosis 02_1987]|nr:DNA/pantothenate metabolism flavoprotein dfp [Mycobacterium tuberculosis 02_1987]
MDHKRIPKQVIVGVSGGIAAYKACTVVRQLTEASHRVRVIPTESALRFVGAATFEALSGEPVCTDVFADVPAVPHVHLGQQADLVVVAPATADLLARAAAGRADDLLTATLLTARCPVLFAPAMHTEMWLHPATVDNVATLRRRGAVVLEPATGRLTGADSGAGRLPEAEEITTLAQLLLERHDALPYDLAGRKLLVTAGGTREPIDPVRFIGNRSSGKQGYAVARVAAQRGADVTLIAGHTAGLVDPAGVEVVHVSSAPATRRRGVQARSDRRRIGDGGGRRRLPARAGCHRQNQERRRRPTDHRAAAQRRRAGRGGAGPSPWTTAQHAGHCGLRSRDRRRQWRRALSCPS